ncbi:efflux RND transporter periplasmic adaptor subunit [Hyphomicrobium sp.]|jgi:RND family efflux transporter MFP subunit|uniref:efflux RND transporter periplasmic adaptor subunit n=1 Tax=Hyphomicrobium sp. TaxID=82 RepID=UPI002B830D4A|nr:efflux RND transporter periplasmic adaptor subunit [Hyphomicrobium sp.]HVZ05667.1 efflux RND transporter periplasmic adaptor subunit [Hyphomicrobium sp.]
MAWTRTFGTLILVAIILLVMQTLWHRYQVEPITRDGKIRADIVHVATDVAGLITEVRVRDNEYVSKGQVLVVMDQPRYELALEQAQAEVASQQASLAQAEREDRRNHAMSTLVATEVVERGGARVEELKAALSKATAARDLAKLNLERTAVRAPVDGYVSNMTLQAGVYMSAGATVAALVYKQSTRIEGYFEETKVPAIHIGDRVVAHLMGVADPIHGHVESISAGVADRERSDNGPALANVNPSFSWVRLAQRIPVRIAIDSVPHGIRLIVGQTATVEVLPRPGDISVRRSFPW